MNSVLLNIYRSIGQSFNLPPTLRQPSIYLCMPWSIVQHVVLDLPEGAGAQEGDRGHDHQEEACDVRFTGKDSDQP